jgi:uncharacterized damage-inducible protein DinB
VLTTSGKAKTNAQEFIEASRVFLRDDFLPKLMHCLERMSDDDIWWRPNEQSNSVGNLVLHLCGNMRQWIVQSIGGEAFDRDRDTEFATRRAIPKAELMASIRSAVQDVDRVLDSLPQEQLLQQYPIQTYTSSGLQVIYHVVEHFSYHLGQILYIYKLRTGADPGFYSHLSNRTVLPEEVP